MSIKHNICFYIVGLLLLFGQLSAAAVAATSIKEPLTAEQLADICEELESAIVDISLEYEWRVDSTMSLEEKFKFVADKQWLIVVGSRKCKMVCSIAPDPNDPNVPLFDRFLFEKSDTTMMEPNELSDHLMKRCYNGQIAKSLYIDSPSPVGQGLISKPDRVPRPWVPNPVKYFSALRHRAIEKIPLPEMLRKGIVRIDNTVEKVNGFNTIRADFLQAFTNRPFKRIYFSVDHGYMPVRYENLRIADQTVCFSVEINSLEKVAEGLWFPSSGAMIDYTSKYQEVNLYQATSKIIVNQGLTEKDFDIDFPIGTKVHDEINGIKYIVKPE